MSHGCRAGRRARKLPGKDIRSLRKQMYDIPAKSGSFDQRNCYVSGQSLVRREGWGADERGWAKTALVKTGFREYWHIRNLLSASFPEIADLRGNIPSYNEVAQTRRLGSSCEIVSRRFDGIELPKIYCSRRSCGNLGQGLLLEETFAKVELGNTFPAAPI